MEDTKTINLNYENQNKSGIAAEHILDKTLDHSDKLYEREVKAKEAELKAKEEAAKANVNTFSNEKSKQQNQMYEEYTNDSIKDLFELKTRLVEEKLALQEEISQKKIEAQEMKAKAELDIKKRYNEAEIEKLKMLADYDFKIEQKKKELQNVCNDSKAAKFAKWFFPLLGIILGVASFALLYWI